MRMQLQPYEAYLETDVQWLGKVPSHWSVLPNRAVFREIIDKGHPHEQMLSVTIERGVLKQSDLLQNSSKKDSSNDDKSNYKLVQPGEIVYNKMRAWQGALGVSPYQGIVSPAYIIVRPRMPQNCEYFHHLMRTSAFTTEAERWSYGITSDQWSLRSDDFKCIQTVVPPPEEQDQIVRFIRHLDQRVNRLIKAKRRLIELLNEQKQAIIHRAVTRGLDPAASLKPSGIDWLGDVPEHWRVLALGRLIDLLTGFPFPSVGFSTNDSDTPLLRGINVNPGKLSWESVARWDRRDTSLSAFALRVGDVVLGMDRPIVSGGTRVATVSNSDLPCLLLQRVCRLRAKDGLLQPFLAVLLSGTLFAEYLAPMFTGISVPHISPAQIKKFPVAIPPENEQAEILRFLAGELAGLNKVVNRAQSEIEYIKEYRTRLVADVVTGQLDVRHLDLPEVEESLIEAIDAGEGDDTEELDEKEAEA